RFLNMMRVFRPTSPMNLGTWLLAGTGALGSLAVAGTWSGSPARALGDGAALGAGVLGAPLAGYTAVLIANTAVPAWQAARSILPVLFLASAVGGAASILDFFPSGAGEARAVKAFGLAGKLGELVA